MKQVTLAQKHRCTWVKFAMTYAWDCLHKIHCYTFFDKAYHYYTAPTGLHRIIIILIWKHLVKVEHHDSWGGICLCESIYSACMHDKHACLSVARKKFREFRVLEKNLTQKTKIYMVHTLFLTDSRKFNPAKYTTYNVIPILCMHACSTLTMADVYRRRCLSRITFATGKKVCMESLDWICGKKVGICISAA